MDWCDESRFHHVDRRVRVRCVPGEEKALGWEEGNGKMASQGRQCDALVSVLLGNLVSWDVGLYIALKLSSWFSDTLLCSFL